MANANPNNWEWPDEDKALWTAASPRWQEFSHRWCSAAKSDLPDPETPKALSLEPLNKDDLTLVLPTAIFIRRSDVTMFERIWQAASFPNTGFIITGQPGTGKTLFLFYILVRLLQQRQVVLFSLDGGKMVLFFHDTVYFAVADWKIKLPTSPLHNVFIWSLFDVWAAAEPHLIFLSPQCFPVQSASLDPIQYRTWRKERCPCFTIFPLWTHEDLLHAFPYQPEYQNLEDKLENLCSQMDLTSADLTSSLKKFPGAGAILKKCYEGEEEDSISLQSAKDALHALLDAAIERFGYAARDVFQGVFHPNSWWHEPTFSLDYESLERMIFALTTGSETHASHEILVVCPVSKTTGYSSDSWQLNFKSDWVAKSVLKQLQAAEYIDIRKKINYLRTFPRIGAVAEWYFVPLAHRELSAPKCSGFWPLTRMTQKGILEDPKGDHPIFVETPVPSNVMFTQGGRELVTFIDIPAKLEEYKYYQPAQVKFPLIDAFTVEFDNSDAILWVIQIITSQSHGSSAASGYKDIRMIVGILKKQLRDATKSDNEQTALGPRVEVRYLLVTPAGDLNKPREWHFPKGWNEGCKYNDHRGKVYGLEIDLVQLE